MTYREKYFELIKSNNKFLNKTAIKSILMDDGGFDDFSNLIRHFDDEIKNPGKMSNQIDRISKGEPLQYVLGYAYFVNSNYIVTPDVLIPRQETEELAVGTLKTIIRTFCRDPQIKIVDIGTGSGVLGIYLKEYFPANKLANGRVVSCFSKNILIIAVSGTAKSAPMIPHTSAQKIKQASTIMGSRSMLSPNHFVSRIFPITKWMAVNRHKDSTILQSNPYCKNKTGIGKAVEIKGPTLGIKFSTKVKTANMDANSVLMAANTIHVQTAAKSETKILISK